MPGNFRQTCVNSHQIDTPPTVALSARIKYSFVGVIRRAQVLAIRDMVPKTPSGEKVQQMVKYGTKF